MTRCEYINILTQGRFSSLETARPAVLEYIARLEAASGETLIALLSDPWGSRSTSSGGGSKSLSYKGASDLATLEKMKESRIKKLLYAIGEAPHPSTPTTVEVRFNG